MKRQTKQTRNWSDDHTKYFENLVFDHHANIYSQQVLEEQLFIWFFFREADQIKAILYCLLVAFDTLNYLSKTVFCHGSVACKQGE